MLWWLLLLPVHIVPNSLLTCVWKSSSWGAQGCVWQLDLPLRVCSLAPRSLVNILWHLKVVSQHHGHRYPLCLMLSVWGLHVPGRGSSPSSKFSSVQLCREHTQKPTWSWIINLLAFWLQHPVFTQGWKGNLIQYSYLENTRCPVKGCLITHPVLGGEVWTDRAETNSDPYSVCLSQGRGG